MQTITMGRSLFVKLVTLFLFVSIFFVFMMMPIEPSLRTYALFSLAGLLTLGLFNVDLRVKVISLIVFLVKTITIYSLFVNGEMYMFPDSINYIFNLDKLINIGVYDYDTVGSVSGSIHVGFYYFYLLIYKLFPMELSIFLTNTILVSVSGIIFHQVILERFNKKIAFSTFLIFVFSSNIFLFGSTILKDPIVIFLTAISMYFYIMKKNVMASLFIALLLVTVRIYSGFSLIIAIIFDFIIFSKMTIKRKWLIAVSLISLSLLMLNFSIVQRYLITVDGFASEISIVNALKMIPITLFKFIFAPLPWNILNSKDIYFWLIFDSILFLILGVSLILFGLKWFKYAELRKSYYIFLIPIIIHAIALSVQYGGDSTRQRSGIFIFIVLTMMIGLFYNRRSTF